MKYGKTAMVIVLAMVLASFAFIAAETDAANECTARVFVEDADGNTVEYEGTGTSAKALISDAFDENGREIAFAGNGNVISVDGVEASSGEAWTIFQWLPPQGWKITSASTIDLDLVNGTSYYVYKSTTTVDGGTTTYSEPEFEPMAKAYFFIAMQEDFDRQTDLNMTEAELREGFWIDGYGSDVAEAFHEACERYGFTLVMNLEEGSELKGWLGNFMGLEDERMASTGASVWKYWSQYYWDGSGWQYGQCMGHYDPSVTTYFGLMRMESSEEEPEIPCDETPADIPLESIKNGCTVRFLNGNDVIATENVGYFDAVSAPLDVTAPAGKAFSGWDATEGDLTYVRCDMDVNALFQDVSLTITNKDAVGTIVIGQGIDLVVSLKNGGGDSTIAFSSSDGSVATVDADGKVKGIGNGTAVITASCGGLSDNVTVTVLTPAESITIDNGRESMYKGDSFTLTYTLKPSTTSVPVTFSSSNTSVATVDSNGKVTAIGKGESNITATCGDKTDSFKLKVVEIESIVIKNEVSEMTVGDEHTLVVKVLPEAFAKPVTFTSSNPAVATVDQNGRITALSVGTTIIDAICEGKNDGMQLTVKSKEIDNDDPDINIKTDGERIDITIDNKESAIPKEKVESAIDSVSGVDGKITVSVSSRNDKVVFEKESLQLLASKDASVVIVNGGVSATYPMEVVSALSSGQAEFRISLGTDGLTDSQKSVCDGKTVVQLAIDVDGTPKEALGGTATVTMAYTLGSGQNPGDLVVYHIGTDGSKTTMETSYEGGKVTFTTDHHSAFMIGEKETPSGNGGGDSTMIVIAGIVVAIVAIAMVAFVKTRQK